MSDDFIYDPKDRSAPFAERLWSALSGSEPAAAAWIRECLVPFGLPPDRLQRLQTAVAEAVLSSGQSGREAHGEGSLLVRISVSPAGGQSRQVEAAQPALPVTGSGWGFFLVQRLLSPGTLPGVTHLIELVLYQEGGPP
jgi:hypothetical protein